MYAYTEYFLIGALRNIGVVKRFISYKDGFLVGYFFWIDLSYVFMKVVIFGNINGIASLKVPINFSGI